MGGNLRQIDAALDKSGRLNIFGIGSADNGTYYKYQLSPAAIGNTTRWSDWISLGGNLKQIDTALDKSGRLNIFGIGSADNGTYYKYQLSPAAIGNTTRWSEWISLGGNLRQIDTALDKSGRLNIFGIENNAHQFSFRHQLFGDTDRSYRKMGPMDRAWRQSEADKEYSDLRPGYRAFISILS